MENAKTRIEEICRKIEKYGFKHIVHILNGSCMLEMFNKYGLIKKNADWACWNEAMCEGDVDEVIFSEKFIDKRIETHHSTKEEYDRIVLENLKPVFKNEGDCIVCWFGRDMFCQINCLTLLAYLDQVGFKGKVYVVHFDEDDIEATLKCESVSIEKMLDNYKKIMIEKKEGDFHLPLEMRQAVAMYLKYELNDSEIIQDIMDHLHLNDKELVKLLMKKYKKYGLGDLQYQKMIQKRRKRKNKS